MTKPPDQDDRETAGRAPVPERVPRGDLDDGGLSPEAVLLAAIRQSRRETLGPAQARKAEPPPASPKATATPTHHLPMINRAPAPAATHAEPAAPPPSNPFTAAPVILPQNDSGAGMGFEFSLARRPGRRNR